MSNEKVFKTYEEQKEILESRNLTFLHPRRDIKLLSENNYYFVTGYKHLLLESNEPEKYKDSATFDEMMNLYKFDRKLKLLFLEILLEIEQKVKTTIAYEISKHYGINSEEYLSTNNFDQTNKFLDETINKLTNQLFIYGKKNDAIIHYKSEHGYIPLWVAIKVFTFGSLRNLYAIMKTSDQDYIARSILTIDINKKRSSKLQTYLQLLVVARNLCAHDELFFNFIHGAIKISLTQYHNHFDLLKNKNGEPIQGRKDLFALLIVIKHFVSKTRYKKFIKELHKIIKHQTAKSNCYTYDELIRYMHLPNKFEDIANL